MRCFLNSIAKARDAMVLVFDGQEINGQAFVGERKPGRIVTILGDTRKTKNSVTLAQRTMAQKESLKLEVSLLVILLHALLPQYLGPWHHELWLSN
jgi:hypothetical protein